ncbi:hypothetical protein J580_1019 [Acinetobacter sp. 1542444]|uniref:hypothetical protein n=1 Tax=Acinetobacter sp. 1542444 TaxID=1310681 RepID=UPI000453AA69|nr:hypothetical protein [Acinetobacter sp. 1542444]EXE62014.1 hypothetical protein J580_1019 [Acinetobacter sp. 1542444]
MSKNALSDLAKVIVNNFYMKTKDTSNLSGSYIGDILFEVVEADRDLGGLGYPVEMYFNNSGMTITLSTTKKTETFTWDQVPKGDNKKEVVEFIERILRDYFYA